jgi:hypothetical protein
MLVFANDPVGNGSGPNAYSAAGTKGLVSQ